MAHHTYHTECLILSARPMGEANRMVAALTRDLGLVHAVARASREGRSKLRYALQGHAHASISLVRGREVWRVVGAVPFGDVLGGSDIGREGREALARVFRLVERLIAGEGGDHAVFETVLGFSSVLRNTDPSSDLVKSAECVAVLRILRSLGYLREDAALEAFAAPDSLAPSVLASFGAVRPRALAHINAALRATHL